MTYAERRAELRAARAIVLDELLPLRGEERVLAVGAGTYSFASDVAARVRELVVVETDEELAERARADAPPNLEVVVADGEHLPFDPFSFDVVASVRTLHRSRRPELQVAELVRVARPGGTILVIDQLAPVDPSAAAALNQFEQSRDPFTTRVLSDGDLRALFDANGLRLVRAREVRESSDLGAYLDIAERDGPERAGGLVPTGYEAIVGWYVLVR
jgi:ubiquinone/menaquinone biosynthesis C-methylase UbiE